MLISISFLRLVPRSLEMSARAPAFLLVGFLAIYMIDRFLRLYACLDDRCQDQASRVTWGGVIPVLGIAFRSLIDGVIYAVTFNVSVLTGRRMKTM